MAAPIVPLQIVQFGVEVTRGTAVPATTILDMDPGGATLLRNPTMIRVRQAGSLATSHRQYVGRQIIQLDISGPFTYNWAPNWFNLFLGPLAAGLGAGANKTWTFDGTVISDIADNLKSFTGELGGKDTWPSEYQVKGLVGKKLDISISQDKVWTYKATLLGQLVTPQAKTGALSVAATIIDVLGTTTKVYIDTSAAAFGTTQRVGSVIKADISIEIGGEAPWAQPRRIAASGDSPFRSP